MGAVRIGVSTAETWVVEIHVLTFGLKQTNTRKTGVSDGHTGASKTPGRGFNSYHTRQKKNEREHNSI